MKNVVITTSYRFEETNLLLEILKLNFKSPIKTHVFCNLNESGWNEWGHLLDFSLIDEFHHVPDHDCHPTNTTRDSKRRQPLQMFCQVVAHFGRLQENFVYLEGDCYPLDEKQFLGPFEGLQSHEAIINHFNFSTVHPKNFERPLHRQMLELAKSQIHKMPDGYVYPGTMYISGQGAQKLFKYIMANTAELLDGKKNFEGCLGMAFTRSGITHTQMSNTFCFVVEKGPSQIDPVTSVVHQDRMFDLRESFIQHGISQGKWVETALKETSFTRATTGFVVKGFDNPIEIGSLVLGK